MYAGSEGKRGTMRGARMGRSMYMKGFQAGAIMASFRML